MKKIITAILVISAVAVLPLNAADTASSASADSAMFAINNLWIVIAAALVFIMHLGFAALETGLTRAKNTVNILFKNTAVVAIGLISYAAIGFSLMYPGESWSILKIIGFKGFGLSCPPGEAGLAGYAAGQYTYWTEFLFQGMFAATAATIVSGAVAERIKLGSFLIFSAVYVSFVYPVTGSWGWGKGWLYDLGFHDFAGSTFVHSVGGWAALAGIVVLGPRLGKYVNGQCRPIPGHSLPLAAIGVFLLWLGWFGFNGGSVLSADPAKISYVLVTTTLAAASGILSSMLISWLIQKKPDLSMVLNGCLAGLVAVTAGADVFSVQTAIFVGLFAGALVVLAVLIIDKLKLDDPVGAVSVHLVNGIWGTLAVGLFVDRISFTTQLLGVSAIGTVSIVSALAIFLVLKYTCGIRVGADEEMRGLDIGEHGMEAYSGFQIFTLQ